MSNELLDPVEVYNANVLAELAAESVEMKKARCTMGEVSKMEYEYGKLQVQLEQLAGKLTRRVALLETQLDIVATRHPKEAAANGWVGFWRKIGCPHYREHGRP